MAEDHQETGVAAPSLKIALIGSAPSSVHLAPYGDRSWTIWGCSPGASPHVKRVDAWFELHPFDEPDITPDYVKWIADLNRPVYMIEPVPEIPKSIAYPKQEMLDAYGPYFFTSSLAWMLALAIRQKPAEIALFGVDMSANEEYGLQRPGCHYFLMVARSLGIKVSTPPQSDLLRPPMQYGYCMASPMYRKLMARKRELQVREQQVAAEYEAKRNEWHFYKGALDDLEYMLNTWVE